MKCEDPARPPISIGQPDGVYVEKRSGPHLGPDLRSDIPASHDIATIGTLIAPSENLEVRSGVAIRP